MYNRKNEIVDHSKNAYSTASLLLFKVQYKPPDFVDRVSQVFPFCVCVFCLFCCLCFLTFSSVFIYILPGTVGEPLKMT